MAEEINGELNLTNYVTSRKRARLDPPPTVDLPPLPFQFTTSSLDDHNQLSRFHQSQAASTSTTPYENDQLFSYFHQFSDMNFDANQLRLQNEKLLLGFEETWKRRSRSLILAIRQQVIARLIERETELEIARRRNCQLEERLMQINSEIVVWFDAARNNEAVATALQTKLDQAISTIAERSAAGGCDGHDAEDAQSSCCVEGSEDLTDVAARRRRVCGVCGEKDACVLLLPCRHLCVCKDCEPMTATCPLCCSFKNASLEISLC